MTDWKRGGWTGSLNGWVRREIQEHTRLNPVARRTRYSFGMRALHRIFDSGSFWWFVATYALVCVATGLAEISAAAYVPHWIPPWSGNETKQFLTNVTGFLITAQVSSLGVVSIAIGLITIIAQRENAATDVKVYYHESLAFGLVASSIALLAVLCIQLLWPIQFATHWLGYGTELLFFKVLLTAAHLAWIILNLAGLAHFVATTLAFVQQKAREGLRERYSTNVMLPFDMRRRLREHLFLGAGPQFVSKAWTSSPVRQNPVVYLGTDFNRAGEVEVPVTHPSKVLEDVRMRWIEWVVCRWLGRCANAPVQARQGGGLAHDTLLLFPAKLDVSTEQDLGLCRRRGGVPLTRLEKFVIRWAFKYRRKRDEP